MLSVKKKMKKNCSPRIQIMSAGDLFHITTMQYSIIQTILYIMTYNYLLAAVEVGVGFP